MSELTDEQYTMLQDRLAVPGIPQEQRKRFAPLMKAYEQKQTAVDAPRVALGRDPEGTVLPAELPEVLATPPGDIPAAPSAEPEPDAPPPFEPGKAASFLPEGMDAPYFYQEPPQKYGEGDEKFAKRAEEEWTRTEAAFREANAPVLRVAKITADEVGPLSFLRGKAAELYEPILGGIDETVSGGGIREALSGLIGESAHSPEIQQALAQLQAGTPSERVQETMEASPGKTLLGNVAGFAVPGPGVGKAVVGAAAKGAQKIAGAVPFKGALGKAGGDIAESIMKGLGATTAGVGTGATLEAVDQAVKSAAGQEAHDAERLAQAGIAGGLLPGIGAGSRATATILSKLPGAQGAARKAAAATKEAWKARLAKLSKPAEEAKTRLTEGYAKLDGLKLNKRKSKNTIPIAEARKKYGDERIDKLLKVNPKGKYISVTPRTTHDQRRLGRFVDDMLIAKKDKVGSEKELRTLLKNSPELLKEMDTLLAAPGTKTQVIAQFIKNHKSKVPGTTATSAMISRAVMKLFDTHEKMKEEDE